MERLNKEGRIEISGKSQTAVTDRAAQRQSLGSARDRCSKLERRKLALHKRSLEFPQSSERPPAVGRSILWLLREGRPKPNSPSMNEEIIFAITEAVEGEIALMLSCG